MSYALFADNTFFTSFEELVRPGYGLVPRPAAVAAIVIFASTAAASNDCDTCDYLSLDSRNLIFSIVLAALYTFSGALKLTDGVIAGLCCFAH